MACGNFSVATGYLKVATLLIVLAYILHIAGYSVPRWSALTFSIQGFGVNVDVNYYSGIWKDCSCTDVLGTETCSCFSKLYIPEWMKPVQAMATIGTIGVHIAIILTLIILFSRQGKTMRVVNLVVTGCSGFFIVIGVIIFGAEYSSDYDKMAEYIDSLPFGIETEGSLAVAFFLSTIAGVLSLLVCTPLLIMDYLTPQTAPTTLVNPIPVQYTNQGVVMNPPAGQTHVFVHSSGQQPVGYMQTNQQGPAVYAPPGQYVQSSSAYPPQAQQQYGMQYSQQGNGIPPKS